VKREAYLQLVEPNTSSTGVTTPTGEEDFLPRAMNGKKKTHLPRGGILSLRGKLADLIGTISI